MPVKLNIVESDPSERGIRKVLNFGHTIGHALESYRLGEGKGILHGEAIAVGLIAESYIAEKMGLLSSSDLLRISTFILKTYGKINIQNDELSIIAQLTLQDKKNKNNKIMCVLLDGIGKAKWDCAITVESVVEALSFYQQA